MVPEKGNDHNSATGGEQQKVETICVVMSNDEYRELFETADGDAGRELPEPDSIDHKGVAPILCSGNMCGSVKYYDDFYMSGAMISNGLGPIDYALGGFALKNVFRGGLRNRRLINNTHEQSRRPEFEPSPKLRRRP